MSFRFGKWVVTSEKSLLKIVPQRLLSPCMDIATGIQWMQRSASIVDGKTTSLLPIAELGSRGLPKSKEKKIVCSLDFRQFQDSAFGEYLTAFGTHTPDVLMHSTWSIVQEGIRFVIPALALIRAFAHPQKLLLQKLFQPQSLDDICTYLEAVGEARVRLIKPYNPTERRELKNAMGALSWFYCFPSARRAWASVFQAAHGGCIHLELPSATITFMLTGEKVNGSIFVTELVLRSIECHEQPFDFAYSHPLRIENLYRRYVPSNENRLGNHHKLTEEEWDQISKVLDSFSWNTRRGRHDRAVTDAILLRMFSKIYWSTAAQMNQVGQNQAASTFNRWQSDGRLEKVIEKLHELRDSKTDLYSPQKRHNANYPVYFSYKALSQIEWDCIKDLLGPRIRRGVIPQHFRALANYLWIQQSPTVSLQAKLRLANLELPKIKYSLRRWQADGRFDRITDYLRTLESPVSENSEFTDDQWLGAASIVSPPKVDPYQNNRDIFDCLLEKILSGSSWEIAAHKYALSVAQLRSARRLWETDRRFDRAVAKLQEMRATVSDLPVELN